MRLLHNLIYLLCCVSMFSCVSSFTPNISEYDDLLVVDGELTNLSGPYKVKLSRSYKFQEKSGDPITGAQVKIIENAGREVELREISDGTYSTVDTTFRGIVGNNYKLHIQIGEEVYESASEKLIRAVPIDKVYWEYSAQNDKSNGIQLLLDTHDPENSTHYYAWKCDENWKFIVPIDVIAHPEWKVCYAQFHTTDFNIATSARRNNDIIERQPLRFFSEATNRLYIRYTTLVRQYALSESAYKFFKDLISVNQNQGSLFDPIPGSLVGNMSNLTHKEMPVLGYFLVAGASEKRIFIDRKDLPKEYQPTSGFDNCGTALVQVPTSLTNIRMNSVVDSLMRNGYSEFERFRTLGTPPDTTSYYLIDFAKSPCFNCLMNGNNVIPDFWTESSNQ